MAEERLAGPARWVPAGFLAGVAVTGLIWSLTTRAPRPELHRATAPNPPGRSVEAPPVAVSDPEAPSAPAESPVSVSAAAAAPTTAADAPDPPGSTPDEPAYSVVDPDPPLPPWVRDDPSPVVGMRIRVNSATSEELQILPRIGPAMAARIIEDRERNGPFRSLEDLQRVRGIGPRTAEGMADLVRFD